MKAAYWEKVSAHYDELIFDVLASDRQHKIQSLVNRFGGKRKVAADFGCGTGRFIPMLCENFFQVYSLDLSENNIQVVNQQFKSFKNLQTFSCDLSKALPEFLSQGEQLAPSFDFILSVNVIIMPDLLIRRALFKQIKQCLKSDGICVMVVPSVESALFAYSQLLQWNIQSGLAPATAKQVGFEAAHATRNQILKEGIIDAGGVPTKHYLKEELMALCQYIGLKLIQIEKLEYPWTTEFIDPPDWMQAPYPWDWLLTLKNC